MILGGMDAVRVRLPDDFVRDHLRRLAEDRVAESKSRSPRYGHNTVEGQEVGLKGEAAVFLWADDHGFTINGFDGYGMPDVCLGCPGPPWIRIEVKTWQSHNWVRLGRQVAATQLRKIVGENQLVVWAVAERADNDGSECVALRGWTSTDDLLTHGRPRWTAGLHANLKLSDEWLTAMDALVAIDPTALRFPSMAQDTPPCGHAHVLGKCWGCAPPPAGPAMPKLVRIDQGYFHLETAAHRFDARTDPQVMSLVEAAVKYATCRQCFPMVW